MKEIVKAGNKYGRLTAIKFSHYDKKYNQYWLFECDCGNKKATRANKVKKGIIRSCGCLSIEKATKHGMSKTRTYRSWEAMKRRCLSPKATRYEDWGGRGITVCKKWMKFENFYKDMGNRPKNKTLDRKDNNLKYCKSNCRWASSSDQAKNRRKKRY